MKVRIENTGGRHLGTYEAESEADALFQYCRENTYLSVDEAERKRFVSLDRLVFFEEIDQ